MSTFSDLLKQHINDKGISVRKLSMELEIDRTLLQKYMSGSRTPKNHLEVRKIAKGISLSSAEQDDLLGTYYESIYAPEKYGDFLMIRNVLAGTQDFRLDLDELPPASEALPVLPSFPEAETHSGTLQVEYAFTSFLKEACTDAAAQPVMLYAMLQPRHIQLMRLIMLHTAGQNVQIEQLICLEQHRSNGNLSTLLPVIALFMNDSKYHCRYYYDDMKAHVNQMTLFPVLLLTENAAFLSNYHCDSCCIIRNKAIVEFFRQQYASLSQSSEELGIPLQFFTEYTTRCVDYFHVGDSVEVYSYSPLFSFGMTEEMLMSHLTINDAGKALFMQSIKHEFGIMKAAHGMIEFYEKDALREFMETGEFPAFPPPEGFYRRPAMDVRLQIMRELIRLNQVGLLISHMSDHTYFRLSKENQIISNALQGDIEIRCQPYARSTSVLLREPNLCNTLHEFGEFALANNWFLSQEETVAYMQALVDEFSPQG